MTPEQQIKALAELDGCYKETASGINLYKPDETLVCVSCYDVFVFAEHIHQLPKYLTSYDAIIPLIQKCIGWPGFKNEFHCGYNYNKFSIAEVFTTTPPQLCEALLKAVGKWNE